MAHTIVGKLNQAATQFQAGDGTGFGVRVGVQYYDRETKQKEWTNFEAVIFANQAAQIQFYQSALVEGSVIELSGESIKIKTFDGQNGQKITLELIGAKLGYVHTGQQPQQNNHGFAQQNAPQQGGYQNNQPQGGFQQQSTPQQQGGYAPQGGFNPNQNPNDPPF
jgi:hypothetical protein